MKIAVNTRFLLNNKLEGIGHYTYEILSRMVKNHPEDEFIFLFDRPFDQKFVFADNVRPIVISPPARHPILWKIWFEWSLKRFLNKEKADVFFSPDGYLSLKAETPTLLTVHDLAYIHYPSQVPKNVYKYYKKHNPLFLKKADAIVTVSKFVKKDILSHFQEIDANKIQAVQNACRGKFQASTDDEKRKTRAQFNNGRSYFLFVGAIHPRKNMVRILKAFDLFAKEEQNVDLLIAGRMAWQNKAHKDTYEQLKHKDRIKFLGFVPDNELPSLLAAADCFVYPSLFEGFGLPILEAFHAEVPVITSNVSSMPEVAGQAAILINPDRHQDIYQAMKTLNGSEDLKKELIKKGKIQREKFSWDIASEKIYASLKKIALN